MKKQIIWILGAAIVIVLGYFAFTARQPASTNDAQGIVLYYGDGCPHCANVDKFIEENKVGEKVSFEKKEVFNNRANARDMGSKAKMCKIDTTSGMGVPFLWDGEKCYQGDVDVINFFKSKTGLE